MGDTRELSKIFFETVKVLPVDNSDNEIFSSLIDEIVNRKLEGKTYSTLEKEIDDLLSKQYSLTDDERSLVSGY